MAEAARLTAGADDSAEVAFVDAHGSMTTWLNGDLEGGVERAQRARAMALRTGDARTASTALVALGTIELRRDPEAGHALLLEAVAEAGSAGFTEQHARALNNLGGFGLDAPHHAFAETYLPEAIEYCVAHNEDLWRINALALAARYALDRGRWTEAADLANRILQDPRESPWPHHEALVVLALVRARRGDPGATSALDEADGVGVPPDEVDVHVDVAAARAEVAVLEQRPDDVVRATTRCWSPSASGETQRSCAASVLAPARRPRRRSAGRSGRPVRPRSRGRLGSCCGRVGAIGVALRGGSGADRGRRRDLAPASARAVAGTRSASRLPARSAAPPRSRRQGPGAGPTPDDARERGRPDPARERGADAPCGRPPQRRDRTAALPLAAHGRPPRLLAAAEARCRLARRGDRLGPRPRPTARPVARPRKPGNCTDVARRPPGIPSTCLFHERWEADEHVRHPPPARLAHAEDLEEAAARSTAEGDPCRTTSAGSAATSSARRTDGGTVCIYQASSPEAIRRHASGGDLPVDEIVKVADTVVVRGDPVPAHR